MNSHLENSMQGDRKRKRPQCKETLELVLDPPSVPAKKRRLDSYPCVHADQRNCIVGTINGKNVNIMLDSGANTSFLLWNNAKRLGLITGQEATVPYTIELFHGPATLDVVKLDNVTIDLGSGVIVVTPVIVFPEEKESEYDPDDMVVDVRHMRRGGMIQAFRPDGSDVFVRKPQQLLTKVRDGPKSYQPDVLRIKPANNARKPMTMLVDTGAVGIHISEKRRKILTRGRKNCKLPKRVAVDIGDGCCLRAEPLEEVGSNDDDFLTGVTLLAKYNAVVDYARHTVTFNVES